MTFAIFSTVEASAGIVWDEVEEMQVNYKGVSNEFFLVKHAKYAFLEWMVTLIFFKRNCFIFALKFMMNWAEVQSPKHGFKNNL